VNTTARQARSKVKKAVAKTSKKADANVRQARSKVKKAVAREAAQITNFFIKYDVPAKQQLT
jgi:hypothetical protein